MRMLTNMEHREYLMRVIQIAIIIMLSAFIPTFSYAQDFTATTVGDYGNVTVMEVIGNYDAINPDETVNSTPREVIAKEFFRLHKDEYDFLVIFTSFDFKMPAEEAAAFYLGVKNDTQGIGKQLFDYTELFGSNGKLQGIIDMGNVSMLVVDPLDPQFEATLRLLSHEQMHRWAAYVKYIDENGEISTALLGLNEEHWSFLLDSQASVLYGNDWKDNGDGTFTSIDARKYYSPLDLYLMGLYDKSQVDPMLLINNPNIDPWKLPEIGATISGTPQYITIDDIIAAEGERIPGPSESQKSFKTAFIFIAAPGTFDFYDLFGIENIRNGWVTRFSILTDGKGIMQVAPTPIDEIPSNPGVPQPVPPSPVPPGLEDGVAWLISNQKSDGSWENLTQTATRDTEEAAVTLKNFTNAQTNYAMALQWLSGSDSVNVDYLSRKIAALSESGQDVQALVSELISLQNTDGGWGSNRIYGSAPIDTAFALKALIGIQYADQDAVSKSSEYLISRQNADGGWGFSQEDDGNVFMTATVLGVLQKLPNTISVTAANDKAKTYILAHQNADGGFGSSPSTVYETALSSLALKGVTTDNTILGNAVNYLKSMQADDGSWNEDPYSTALAVRVLYLTKDLPAPPPQPTTSTVTGKVVDGVTNQPLSNVMVVLLANADTNTVTDATGNFTLSEVPGGTQSISFSLSGYMTTTVSVDSTPGSIIDLGDNSLYPISTAGIIRGTVTDITNGMPLADATVEVTGSFTGTASTGADGSFVIGNVTPGSLTLTASKDGYTPVSITGTISSGEVLFFYPQLSPVSTPPATGSATGKVVDGSSGLPLGGVLVVLQSDTNIQTTTDSTGAFTLSNIPAGPQKISLSYSGYGTTTVSANIPGGSTLDLGVLPLASNPTVGVMKGTVTDADTGQPLEGVTITLTGSYSGSAETGTDGGFVINDITPGSITFTASKQGYYSLNGSSTINAGEVTIFNFQMTPLAQPGTLTGKVFDAAANTPINGAVVFISGGPETTTDEQGVFTISDVVPGTREVNISASGYQSQKYWIVISGSTTDMQTIFLSPVLTSTTVTGIVTDASTGNPISNADIVIVGTSIAAKTDSSGSYTLSGINLLEFNLKASAAGYDTRFNGMHTEAYGQYMIDIGLSRSQASNVEIIALGTDKETYSAKSSVTITANIENTGATPVDVIIAAQVMDQDNNLLAVIAYDTDPYVTLDPNGSEAISLQWDTGIYPPGNYDVFLSVVDSENGALLAEGSTAFGIASTAAIEGVVPLMTPKFLNIGATAIVSISASVTNSSNVDVSLVAEYEIKDTGGNIITGGTTDFTITPAESLKTVELGKVTYTFAASGQYPVIVKIRSEGSVVLENSDAIHVAPSMRIETTKILNPTTVTPEGDKRIRIDIRLQGVEVTQ